MARRRKNPWTSTGEVVLWILVVVLLFPAAFAGYAVGHYTSLGKPPATVTVTTSNGGSTSTQQMTTSMTTTAMTTTSSSNSGQIAAGKMLFASEGCSSCHALAAANANGQVGPNLDKAIVSDAQADHNMPLAAFVKESIVNPSAYIAKGYSDGIMPHTFGSLSSAKINDLVALILSDQK